MIAVEDDASRKIHRIIETDGRSSAGAIELLDRRAEEYAGTGKTLEVMADHGAEFYAMRRATTGTQITPSRNVSPSTT